MSKPRCRYQIESLCKAKYSKDISTNDVCHFGENEDTAEDEILPVPIKNERLYKNIKLTDRL